MALSLCELFGPTLQGEGVTMGVPAFFIRFSSCNLMCGGPLGELLKTGKASWHCDTESVWKHGKPYEADLVIQLIDEARELQRVVRGDTHVVFTGGEPCQPQNLAGMREFMEILTRRFPGASPYYEVETNGTLTTAGFLGGFVDQVNCSPKLSNSGMPQAMRLNRRALEEIGSHPNGWFKFVVSRQEDWLEIERDFLPLIDRKKVILMPAASSLAELEPASRTVWEIASRENVRACTRMHIIAWNKTTGV